MFYCYMIFSILLMHEKMYSHRVISIIMISISFLMLLLNCESFELKVGSFIILLTYNFLTSGIDALFSVLVKIHFNKYLTDPYLFIFYLGLFPFLFIVHFDIIYHLFFGGNNSFIGKGILFQIISNSDKFLKNLLFSFLLMLIYLFTYCSQILVIYHFTPSHFIIFLMIDLAEVVVINWSGKFKVKNKVVFIVSIIIIMVIFLLIYNEVIIIKLFSLKKNTAKYISLRQKDEYDKLDQVKNNDEDEKLNDSFDNLICTNE